MPGKKIKDNFLRSSVLEANQVKKTAWESAKLTVENQFKEHLSNAWSKALKEELQDPDNDGHGKSEGGETDVDAVTETTTLDSSEIGGGDNKQSDKDSRSSSKIENPEQEVEKMGEGAEVESDGHEKVLNQLTEDDEELDLDDEDEDDIGAVPSIDGIPGDDDELDLDFDPEADDDGLGLDGEEDEDGFDIDFDGEEEEDEVSLEALIRELEADVNGGMEEDISALAKRDNATQTMDMEPSLAPEGDGEDVLRLENSDSDDDEESDDDKELEEILREMEVEEDIDDVVETLRSQVAEQKRNLKEHRDVITFLRNRLMEINMLNAKLLYTNKLFKQHNLNAGEKVRVYETFDRVTTVREAKLLYTTLTEVFGSSKPKKNARRVVESVASMPVGSTKSKTVLNESKAENEDAKLKRRMMQIAGLLND